MAACARASQPADAMLTLRQIEVFRAVMRAGTIVGAAQQLQVSQPTVTKIVARLEQVLKTVLFQRVAGRIVPTGEARRLMAETDASYAEFEASMQRAARAVHADEGLLRVGSQPSLTRMLAVHALADLVARMPRISVHLDVLPVAEVLDYVRRGPGECALTVFPVVSSDVTSVELGTLRGVALVPKGLKLAASRAPLSARAAAREAVITFEPHAVHGRLVLDFFAASGATPAHTHMVRFADSAVAMAEAGLGIAIVDQISALAANRSLVTARPLAFAGTLPAYLHRPRTRSPSRLSAAFQDAVQKRFDALSACMP